MQLISLAWPCCFITYCSPVDWIQFSKCDTTRRMRTYFAIPKLAIDRVRLHPMQSNLQLDWNRLCRWHDRICSVNGSDSLRVVRANKTLLSNTQWPAVSIFCDTWLQLGWRFDFLFWFHPAGSGVQFFWSKTDDAVFPPIFLADHGPLTAEKQRNVSITQQ